MGKINSRNKGKNGEREVIDRVFQLTGIQLQRNLDQTRDGGQDLLNIPWMSIEVKRQEQLLVDLWWEQTLKQARRHQIPVLIYRQSRKPWTVVTLVKLSYNGIASAVRASMSLEEFCLWLSKVYGELNDDNQN